MLQPLRAEIAEHGYVLTPGRYVGAEEVEDDGVPFAEKMEGLTRELATQFHESEKLQAAIRDNIRRVDSKRTFNVEGCHTLAG